MLDSKHNVSLFFILTMVTLSASTIVNTFKISKRIDLNETTVSKEKSGRVTHGANSGILDTYLRLQKSLFAASYIRSYWSKTKNGDNQELSSSNHGSSVSKSQDHVEHARYPRQQKQVEGSWTQWSMWSPCKCLSSPLNQTRRRQCDSAEEIAAVPGMCRGERTATRACYPVPNCEDPQLALQQNMRRQLMMQAQARRINQQQRVNPLSGLYTNTSLIMSILGIILALSASAIFLWLMILKVNKTLHRVQPERDHQPYHSSVVTTAVLTAPTGHQFQTVTPLAGPEEEDYYSDVMYSIDDGVDSPLPPQPTAQMLQEFYKYTPPGNFHIGTLL